MFTTPYMSKILRFLKKIWEGHEDDFLWEPSGAAAEINRDLTYELARCRDLEYSGKHYTTGPADEWISNFKF